MMAPLNPRWTNLYTMPACQTISKSLVKSRNTALVVSPLVISIEADREPEIVFMNGCDLYHFISEMESSTFDVRG